MIYQIFLQALARVGHSSSEVPAIVSSQGISYSYQMVEEKINQWAHYLLAQDIKPQDRVGVLLDNEDLHVFLFLALDRINATYVPFDLDVPKAQLSIDIATLSLKKIMIEPSIQDQFIIAPSLLLPVCEALDVQPIHAPSVAYDTEGFEKTTYIVSSSGSTGKKKWIPIQGEGLLYWANLEKERMESSPVRILSTRSPAYDARIFEYVSAFATCGTLYLLSNHQRRDFTSVLSACEQYRINTLLLIASQMNVEHLETLIAKLTRYGLQHLLVTGDACTPHLKTMGEKYHLKIWNCYGPSEATFGLSILLVNGKPLLEHEQHVMLPIGKPLGVGVNYHIIDQTLYIESLYLMLNYIEQEDEDASFRYLISSDGKMMRLFNTGDHFQEKEGFLYYLGRAGINAHCKINGVKVTPFYIEHCINQYSSQDYIQSVVVIKKHLGQDKPFAYIITHTEFNKAAFLAYLKDHLKKEEFPIIIQLDELPRLVTSNKFDRLALIHRQDSPNDLFFGEGRDNRKKFSNDNQGVDFHRVDSIIQALLNNDHLAALSVHQFCDLLDEAVLISNHIDQQGQQFQLDQSTKESQVWSLLELAYTTLAQYYPEYTVSNLSLSLDASRILSTTAQLFHYLGKAKRYVNEAMPIRSLFFEQAITISQFLETGESKDDPNYFKARTLTYLLPVIYLLKDSKQYSLAIERAKNQLQLAYDAEDSFHVIQAYVQLSDCYLLNDEADKAFEAAEKAYQTVQEAAFFESILFFNAHKCLMLAAEKKQDKTLVIKLADEMLAYEQSNALALKAHHLTAAKEILAKYRDDYTSVVKQIWLELFQLTDVSEHTEFLTLGGNSLKAYELVHKINQRLPLDYRYQCLLQLKTITIQSIANQLQTFDKPEAITHAFIQPLTAIKPTRNNMFLLPPLLGEGYFTYKQLVHKMYAFDKNIYALTDPGVIDEQEVPTSLQQATDRYLAAIKSIQPEGPYELMGYSFGATLAYKITETLEARNERVKKLFILDGFPAELYRLLPDHAHFNLLETLLNFVILTLNNHFYKESLPQLQLNGFITLHAFKQLSRHEQIKQCFQLIEQQVKNPSSIRMLALARQHLSFLQDLEPPKQKLDTWPTFNVSASTQAYWDILNHVPNLSTQSANHQFCFWNIYFTHLTRCGIQLQADHLSIVNRSREVAVDAFWRREHDDLFNLQVDHYGPLPAYRLQKNSANDASVLSIFFLTPDMGLGWKKLLLDMNINAMLYLYDKRFNKYEQRDTIYSAQTCIRAEIPNEHQATLLDMLQKKRVEPLTSRSSLRQTVSTSSQQTHLDLIVKWNRSDLLTLSFVLSASSRDIQTRLNQLQLRSLETEEHRLAYVYQFIQVGCSTYDAIRFASDMLADVMASIYPSGALPAKPVTQATHTTFFKKEKPLSEFERNMLKSMKKKNATDSLKPSR